MERLVGWDNGFAYQIKCFEGDGCPDMESPKCNFCEHSQAVYKKLAAYENSGMTPERWAELAKADRDGRLLMLPCKMGDIIYDVMECIDDADEIVVADDCRVGPFGFQRINRINEYLEDFQVFDEVGKTVFFTKDEAEAAAQIIRDSI